MDAPEVVVCLVPLDAMAWLDMMDNLVALENKDHPVLPDHLAKSDFLESAVKMLKNPLAVPDLRELKALEALKDQSVIPAMMVELVDLDLKVYPDLKDLEDHSALLALLVKKVWKAAQAMMLNIVPAHTVVAPMLSLLAVATQLVDTNTNRHRPI